MAKRSILIPVKELSCAKQRLETLLTQEKRIELAWTMLENTFKAASQVDHIDKIAVVTSYGPAIEKARHLGFDVILETEQISESASIDVASRILETKGVEAVMRLPIDLPLISTSDIETVIAEDFEAPGCVIVPSRDGTGTNALLRRPPTLFRSHFGPGSLAKHIGEAQSIGARLKILSLPRLALDIDDINDIEELGRVAPDSPVHRLLRKLTSSQGITR